MSQPELNPNPVPANGSETNGNQYKHHLKLILLILFADILGTALVIPLLPRYAEFSGFSAHQIGLLMAAYPFAQLFAAPILGQLSDRIGRRPVLIASQMGTTTSFIILAMTQRFELMLLARMIDGASGGNILVAQAYIADVTPPEKRAGSMGLIGMAFGMGFLLGPVLGGILTGIHLGDTMIRLPFLAAAMFSICAWIIVWRKLPESRTVSRQGTTQAPVLRSRGVRLVLANKSMRLLVLSSAFLVLGWSNIESTFSLFLLQRMSYTDGQAAWAFAFLGLVGIFAQGFLVRKLVKRYGEKKLVVTGMFITIFGFLMLSQVHWAVALFLVLIVAGIGHGLATPSMQGLISRSCSPEIQGAVFGTLASAQTFSRMINYYASNQLFGKYGASAPFISGAVILAIGLVIVGRAIRCLSQEELLSSHA